MEQKQYIGAVGRKLKCSGRKKKEIRKQLQSDIGIALEEGRTMAEVLEDMGSVSQLAEEFNENMPEEEIRKAKKERGIIIIAAVIVILVAIGVFLYWWLPKWKLIDENSSFKPEEVTKQAEEIIDLLDQGEYEALKETYADEVMYPYLTEEYMGAVKAQISEDWGARVSFGNIYMTEISQQGEEYVVAEMTVTYENVSVVYRISLNKNLKLVGIFIR